MHRAHGYVFVKQLQVMLPSSWAASKCESEVFSYKVLIHRLTKACVSGLKFGRHPRLGIWGVASITTSQTGLPKSQALRFAGRMVGAAPAYPGAS